MRIQRALVVYRKSLYQIYVEEHAEHSIRRAIRRRDQIALGLRRGHEENQRALASVESILNRLGIEAVVRWRAHVRSAKSFDLVISVGGDGTLLDTSHRIQDGPPLLGVNSDPERSVGALCCGTVQDLPRLLHQLSEGSLRPRKVTRLRLQLDGREVLGPVLNDVLFAHACPAGLSRFDLAQVPRSLALEAHSGHDGAEFRHFRGSGIWVSTAMGSTAAIHSAGGTPMRTTSRQLQYWVREPYLMPSSPPRSAHRGRVRPDQALVLINRTRQGMLWADGAHRALSLQYSQQVVIDRHPSDLLLVRGC